MLLSKVTYNGTHTHIHTHTHSHTAESRRQTARQEQLGLGVMFGTPRHSSSEEEPGIELATFRLQVTPLYLPELSFWPGTKDNKSAMWLTLAQLLCCVHRRTLIHC